jgi:hypothetical protein
MMKVDSDFAQLSHLLKVSAEAATQMASAQKVDVARMIAVAKQLHGLSREVEEIERLTKARPRDPPTG